MPNLFQKPKRRRRTQWEIFCDRFEPQDNHIVGKENACEDGYMYETFGAEHDYVLQIQKQDPRRVWTLVEGDTGENWYVCAGYHWVNRMGYIITRNPWVTEQEQFLA